MEMKLMIDTWGWLTLRDRRETWHNEVNVFFQDFRMQNGLIYTTDYILDETFTMLYPRLPLSLARSSTELIDKIINQRYVILEWITPNHFEKAQVQKNIFQLFCPKPRRGEICIEKKPPPNSIAP